MLTLKKINNLVSEGQPLFGVFDRVENINHLDYDLKHHSHLLSGKTVSQWQKKLRANQFCFVQIVQPPYRLCVAVATLNWVTSSFCYLYNADEDTLELIEALQPFTRNTHFNQSTYHDSIRFNSNKLSIELIFSSDNLQLNIQSKILSVDAILNRKAAPLSVCTPTGKTGWTYTQKEPMIDITGKLHLKDINSKANTKTHNNKNINEKMYKIDLSGATATLDWSVGYMRRITNWYWSCISDYLADGRHFALNLATGVNESGASENACWVDGKRYHLPAVMFRKDSPSNTTDNDCTQDNKNAKNNWHVSNQPLNWSKVKIELSFTPINCYQKNDRLMIVDSIFEQWIGYYSGMIELIDDKGITDIIKIDNIMGLAEDHYAKW